MKGFFKRCSVVLLAGCLLVGTVGSTEVFAAEGSIGTYAEDESTLADEAGITDGTATGEEVYITAGTATEEALEEEAVYEDDALCDEDMEVTYLYIADDTTDSDDTPDDEQDETVDLSALEAIIEKAQSYTKESLYTADSWSALQTALSEATKVLSTEGITQLEVTAQTEALTAAIEALVYNASAPSSIYAVNTQTGIKITWSSVSNAEAYQIWRKVSGSSGDYVRVKTVTDLSKSSWTDTKAEEGVTYSYKVRIYIVNTDDNDSKVYSSYTSAVTGKFLSTPTVTAVTSVSTGTKVTWDAVDGAGGYVVYRKKGSDGTWKAIKTVSKTKTSYTDTASLSSGATYYYAVRAYQGGKTTATESYDSTGKYLSRYWSSYASKSIVSLKAPTLKKATSVASGTKITWSAVTGAKGYGIYRRTESGKWKLIGTTTSTSYTDKTTLKNNTVYYYTVRAYRGSKTTALNNKYSAKYWGKYNTTGLKSLYLSTPTLSSATPSSKNVKVTWSKVSGATGYAVYRKKGSDGTWKLIGTTTSTTYTDTSTLKNHNTYYYTVRAYKGKTATSDANKYKATKWGGYDTTGVKVDVVKNSDGTLVVDTAMYNKAQSYSSTTNWLILTNCTTNRVGIFYGSKGSWDLRYYFTCSCGKSSTPTKKGVFTVGIKGKCFSGDTYTCWYYTQFSGNYLFHSVLYKKGSITTITDGRLGQNLSHGCVRLSITNAKWIYDNIPTGTKVVTY